MAAIRLSYITAGALTITAVLEYTVADANERRTQICFAAEGDLAAGTAGAGAAAGAAGTAGAAVGAAGGKPVQPNSLTVIRTLYVRLFKRRASFSYIFREGLGSPP